MSMRHMACKFLKAGYWEYQFTVTIGNALRFWGFSKNSISRLLQALRTIIICTCMTSAARPKPLKAASPWSKRPCTHHVSIPIGGLRPLRFWFNSTSPQICIIDLTILVKHPSSYCNQCFPQQQELEMPSNPHFPKFQIVSACSIFAQGYSWKGKHSAYHVL